MNRRTHPSPKPPETAAEQLSLEFETEGEASAFEAPCAPKPPQVHQPQPEPQKAPPASVPEAPAVPDEPEPQTVEEWRNEVVRCLRRKALALETASRGLAQYPGDPFLLTLAAFAAAREERPAAALRYIKRYTKRFYANEEIWTCHAIALAQSDQWPQAFAVVQQHGIGEWLRDYYAPPGVDERWVHEWIQRIRKWRLVEDMRPARRGAKGEGTRGPSRTRAVPAPSTLEPAPPLPVPLPKSASDVSVIIEPMESGQFAFLDAHNAGIPAEFLLRHDLIRLSLLKGYDELLCIPHLQGIRHYPYQVETVRKVLKQFRGRVLLADEVGLGKTIEAGMVLKEYDLRGMVDRVLILTPPSLVGQWREEMATKFGLEFATTNDSIARYGEELWSRKRIIASIATARMERHAKALLGSSFDLVIVDEAHHLMNRASKNWKLVDRLTTRFLLLLSATPVQNKLVELYNLLTLLKPGLFKTERQFRASYVTPGKPRVPLNRENLQVLMRDVMIRNTRGLTNVALPPRQALTLRVEPSGAEVECYDELNSTLRVAKTAYPRHRLALSHLLQAAGSSPQAAHTMLRRLAASPRSPWQGVRDAYASLDTNAKTRALLQLLARNPEEKKLVFVRFIETQRHLERVLHAGGFPFARFDGRLSGPQKDAAIDEFRDRVPILLSTESGGEGRNLQFCNTLINYDLPWNPQAIEQRIGRIHRIGQEREVFVFNLATKGTLEDRVLGILDEKIGMFELVVGEIQAILGELDDDRDFADLVFDAWTHGSDREREEAFGALTAKLTDARTQYDEAKRLDDALFGDEFEAL